MVPNLFASNLFTPHMNFTQLASQAQARTHACILNSAGLLQVLLVQPHVPCACSSGHAKAGMYHTSMHHQQCMSAWRTLAQMSMQSGLSTPGTSQPTNSGSWCVSTARMTAAVASDFSGRPRAASAMSCRFQLRTNVHPTPPETTTKHLYRGPCTSIMGAPYGPSMYACTLPTRAICTMNANHCPGA